MQETITLSAEATRAAAGEFVREWLKRPAADRARLACLWGELGSGKTTFVQGAARALGVTETVNSPTFLIMKQYPLAGAYTGRRLYHFDLYRLAGAAELADLGWEEILADPQNLVLVEWPERLGAQLPAARTDVRLAALAGDQRRISY